MARDYSAVFILQVDEKVLEETECFQQFKKELNNFKVNLGDFARSVVSDDHIYTYSGKKLNYGDGSKLYKSYQKFTEDFDEKYGVEIEIGYHSKEDGSRYDGVDGYYFSLSFDDLYQLTPQAERLQKEIGFRNNQFVSYH